MSKEPDGLYFECLNILASGVMASLSDMPSDTACDAMGPLLDARMKKLWGKHMSDGDSSQDRQRLVIACLEQSLRFAKREDTL